MEQLRSSDYPGTQPSEAALSIPSNTEVSLQLAGTPQQAIELPASTKVLATVLTMPNPKDSWPAKKRSTAADRYIP